MAVKYLDNAGTQYLVNKIKAIDGKIPTESQITTMITSALNTYKEGIVTIVESLPQTGEEGKLYLMVDPSDSDVYIIYTWEENAFKRMGSKTFTLTVDSALSSTSTNPVQNKVIKSALDGKANSSHTHGSITNDGKLGTASRVVITGTDKKIGISTVTTTELGYLSGVTSAIQTQLDGKSPTGHTHTAGDVAGLATVATSGSYNDLSNKPSIPIKISDLQDDVDMLTSHEDVHLEDLPNESPNIRFINNSPQITWNDYVYHDPATTLISGPSYEFDDESSLTSKSKIGYTNSSNSQNTVEHIYGQTYGTTKAFFTMKYYYGSNEKNAEEDESCTINSSLVFTLDPNYESAGADIYYDESNAYSDVSPNNENYFLGGYRPFKEIHAKDFMIVRNGYGFSLSSGFDDIYTHTEDTDIHVTASDKTTWNAVSSKANDSDVVHKSGNETIRGTKTFEGININLKSGIAEYGVSGAGISVTYSDKNDLLLAQNKLGNYQSGISYNKFTIYAYDSNNQLIDRTLTYSSSNNALTTTYFRPDNDSIASLGTTGNRWSKVYAVNYYYGNDNTEFSTKFVTTDTNQTISGVKNFAVDVGILNTDTTANTPNLNFRNYKADRGTTDTGAQTITFLDKNAKALTTIESRRVSNGNTATNILTYNTDDSNNTVSGGIAIIKSKTDTNFAPNTDNAVTCGRPLAKWSGVYSTEYYYGANNTPFTDKFVTTDTNQTISGSKTFSDLQIIGYGTQYKGARNAYILPEFAAGYSGLSITTMGFAQALKIGNFVLDANNKPSLDTSKAYIQISTGESNGVNACLLESRNSTSSSLGTSANKWSEIHGTEYYYGSNNVEFSTKFVTSDTAQTISGNKTFSSNVNVYNSDSSTDTANIVLKNSKAERGSTTNIGEQTIFFLDKNNAQIGHIKCDVDSNGYSNLTLQCSDTNDTSSGVQVRKTSTGITFQPISNSQCYLGQSIRRWYSTYTSKINGVEPSSLSLPSDRSARIDISSYFTNTGTGDTNTYTVPANGYINLTLSELTNVHCFSSTSNNLVNYCQTFTKASNSTGVLYVLFPVRKNDVFLATWYTTTTVNVGGAYFIPCQGNV